MKIAVDAMGGDFAPQAIVEGAFLAAKNHGVRVILVGDEDQVSKELSKYPTSKLPIYIHHAPHVVAMHDSPSVVIRRMKDTSIKVAIELAKEGEASGVVSAGNSGATMAWPCIFKKLEGVDKQPLHDPSHLKGRSVDSGGMSIVNPFTSFSLP
jgi:glycerol-3-phosphate acyltransferase PlsX